MRTGPARASKVLLLNANLVTTPGYSQALYAAINTNSANGYIAFALSRLLDLAPDDVVSHPAIGVPEARPGTLADQAADCGDILLVLQDQLRADTPDDWYVASLALLRTLDGLNAKLTVFSLAANSFGGFDRDLHHRLSPAKLSFFRHLGERAGSLGVRGDYTASVLEKMGLRNIAVVGCPSYFETGRGRMVPPASASLSAGRRLGATGAMRLPGFEDQLVHLLQGDFEWPLIRLMHDREARTVWPPTERDRFSDPLLASLLPAAVDDRVHFFTDFAAWKTYVGRNCQAVAGTRLHGAILALNAGVPALVTNPDARAAETCRLFGIPHAPGGIAAGEVPAGVLAACSVGEVNARYPVLFDAFAAWMVDQGLPLAEQPGPGLPTIQVRALAKGTQARRIVELLQQTVSGLRPPHY